MERFRVRFCKPLTPLAAVGAEEFEDWQARITGEAVRNHVQQCKAKDKRPKRDVNQDDNLWELAELVLLCCPEDHWCPKGCPEKK